MRAKIDSARLGFGCAAIPGQLTIREALTLLETAFACGIRHFDTAAMYCAGASELVVGALARQAGSELKIVTKAGIAPANRVMRALNRLRISSRPTLSGRFAPEQVRSSVETSLRKLKVERVDALLLHEVRAHQIRDELKTELKTLRSAGKIATWGIATSVSESEAIIAAHPELCDIIQVPASWLERPRATPENSRLIVHSVLGSRFTALINALHGSEALARKFKDETGLSPNDTTDIGKLMLQAVMARNATGATLFATSRKDRVRQNAELITAKVDAKAVQYVDQIMHPRSGVQSRVPQ